MDCPRNSNEPHSKPLNEYALQSLRPRNAFPEDCTFCSDNPEIRKPLTPPPRVKNSDQWSRSVHFGNTSDIRDTMDTQPRNSDQWNRCVQFGHTSDIMNAMDQPRNSDQWNRGVYSCNACDAMNSMETQSRNADQWNRSVHFASTGHNDVMNAMDTQPRNADQWNRTVRFGNTSYDSMSNSSIKSRIIAGCQNCGSPQGTCTCEVNCDCMRCQGSKGNQYVNLSNQKSSCNCQNPLANSTPRNTSRCGCAPPSNPTNDLKNFCAPKSSFDCDNTPFMNQNLNAKPSCAMCESNFDDEMPTSSVPSMTKQQTPCCCSSLSPSIMRQSLDTEIDDSILATHRSNESISPMYGAPTMTKEKEALLIEDTYTPGIIEDCVECNKDFNAVSFGMYFESLQCIPKDLPAETPMSIVEAFRKRIDIEREHLLDALNCQGKKRELTIESTRLYFSYKPKTELNKALFHLYQAEILFDDRKSTSGSGMNNDDRPYNLDIRKTKQPLVGGSPITVETFIGTTRLKNCERSGGGGVRTSGGNENKKSNSKSGNQKKSR